MKKSNLLLILVFFLAFLLRFSFIGRYPITLYGDEQAFGWNAYNILKTGSDEYGNFLPLQFRSFDDYKAPIPVYLLVPFIKAWGLNSFTIRLPVVIASTLTCLVVFYLMKLFFNSKISLIITFLLAVSPWHVHLSRGFFEATLALLWFILGVYFFLKSYGRYKFLILSMIFFSLALYSYFTPRILVPIFLVFLVWYNISFTNSSTYGGSFGSPLGVIKAYLLSFIFLIITSIPLIYLSVFSGGFSRFAKLSDTNKQIVIQTVNRERYNSSLGLFWRQIFHNKLTVWTRMIKNNYLEHLSLNFWYIYGDNSLRYFIGNMGMFYLFEFPFLLIGLYFLWRDKKVAATLFLGWIFLAPIPASIVGRSFALRSLSMLPAPFVFVGYGIYQFLKLFKSTKYRNLYLILIPTVFVVSIGTVLIKYYFEYPIFAATWWGWENKAAIDFAKEREDKYDQIFISDFYTGSTLAFAVYNKVNPIEYRQAVNNPIIMADDRHLIKLGKYYFGSLDLNQGRLNQKIIPEKSLYFGRPEEPEGEDRIVAPDDGRLIFVIHDTLKKDCYLKNLPKC